MEEGLKWLYGDWLEKLSLFYIKCVSDLSTYASGLPFSSTSEVT